MKYQDPFLGHISRRTFLGTAATSAAISALPFASLITSRPALGAAARVKPNSKFNGVQIGTITYSFRNLDPGMEAVIKAAVDSNCSSIELMSNGIEDWCGAPKAPARQGGPPGMMGERGGARAGAPDAGTAGAARAGAAQGGAPGSAPGGAAQGGAPGGARAGTGGGMPSFEQNMTPEQKAAQEKYNTEIKAWRLNAPMDKFAQLKKMFDDAGVGIHIVKWSPARWSDEEIDYAFKTAKALGAKAITEEWSLDAAKKLGPFAEKHGMVIAFHNHGQFGQAAFVNDVLKPALAVSKAVKLNFDVGHFYGATGTHPNEIIDQYKDRIFSLHLKDKTGPKTTPADTNQVWGQGEAPLADVLLKVRDEKLPYYCDIELEYQIPAWSNSVKEVRTCVSYARQILI
jgi:sugar phosphate isomerase/epimerase